jgi:hypothetical protein
MIDNETTKASDRGNRSLAALADTPEEVEACADEVLDDIEVLEQEKMAAVLSRPDRFEQP